MRLDNRPHHLRATAALLAAGLVAASCGNDDSTAEPAATTFPTTAAAPDPVAEDPGPTASITVDCERGSTLDELPYDRSRVEFLADASSDTRWLRRTFRIENPTDRAVAFEPDLTLRYLDANGETLAELVDIDRTGPAFTVAAGQSAARTLTSFHGYNAEFILTADTATVDELLTSTASCVLVDPPTPVLVDDPPGPPANVEIAMEGTCALDDSGTRVEQAVRVANDSDRPVVVDPLVEVATGSGDRVGLLGADAPTIVDARQTRSITAWAGAFTVIDEPIGGCTFLSSGAVSPSHALESRHELAIDPTRPTEEIVDGDGNVLLAARDDRQLPVTFVHPKGGDARPLVVWLHGLGGVAVPQQPLPAHLAEAGYAVAILNQPETSDPVNSIEGYPLLPGDVTALLDAIEDPDDGFADELLPHVDLGRVAVAGHSIGTAGVFALVAHDCCLDDRIDAGVAFGGSAAWAYDGGDYRFSQAPLLLVHGTADEAADHADAEMILAGAEGNVSLLSLDGADHRGPANSHDGNPHATLARRAMTAFLDVHLAGTADPSSLEGFDLAATPVS